MIRFTSKYKNISKIICRKYLVKKIKNEQKSILPEFQDLGV